MTVNDNIHAVVVSHLTIFCVQRLPATIKLPHNENSPYAVHGFNMP